MIRHIPNTLTLLNLVCGFAATICALQGIPGYASLLVMAGMIFDFTDGFAARLLKARSDIGRELDSLADIITFGVAPGAIVYQLLTAAGIAVIPSFVVALLLPAASALRLARFNTDASQSVTFRGLATPGSAFTLVSLVAASVWSGSPLPERMISSPLFLTLLSLFLAVMMLANITMFSLKFTGFGWRGNEERYLFAVMSLLLLLIFRLAGLPMIMVLYFIISLVANVIFRRGGITGSA